MVGERWLGCLMRCLVLGAMVGVGGCASVEYRVPTWEVQRLTQLPPAMRGGEVRVVPSNAVVPPPPALVAEAPPPPEVDVDVDVEIPVVVAPPPPVVVAPRPVVFPRQVGTTVGAGPRAAPPAGGGWKSGPPGNAGGWRPAPGAQPPHPRGVRPVERRPTRQSRRRRRCRCRGGSGRRGGAHRDLGGRGRHGGGGRRRAPVRRMGCCRCRPPAAPLLRRRPGARGAPGAARPRGSDRPSERRSGRRRRARGTIAARPTARRRTAASSSAPHPARSSGAWRWAGAGRHPNASCGRSSSASSRGHAATGARRPTRARLTGVRSGDTLTSWRTLSVAGRARSGTASWAILDDRGALERCPVSEVRRRANARGAGASGAGAARARRARRGSRLRPRQLDGVAARALAERQAERRRQLARDARTRAPGFSDHRMDSGRCGQLPGLGARRPAVCERGLSLVARSRDAVPCRSSSR